MTNSFDDNETNHVENEYYGEEDNLGDFIVYSDDDEDNPLKKQKLHHQQEDEEQVQEEEEEENEFEEDEEDEEAPEGVQEILSLREQLKEKIRRRNAAMAAGVGRGSSSVKQTAPPAKNRFGTFFGPSRQSLAPRVMQEGCSSMMKELQSTRSRDDSSLVSKARPGARASLQKPKIVSEEKRKADALRENRDYSSLFSDDAEAPPAMKEQPCNRPVPKPDGQARRPVSPNGKNRAPNGQSQTARLLSNGHGLKGAPSRQGLVQNKAGTLGKSPLADRKMTIAAASNGSTTAAMKNQKMQPAHQSKRPQAQHPSSQGQKLQQASQSQRLQSNGHQQMQKYDSSAQGQRSGQNGSVEPRGRAKPAQKQLVASSKLKASRLVEKGAVKRKSNDEVDYALKELRALTGYDPTKYAGRCEDDSNMEADYASIQKEERRSAKLARQEDQEQLRLIEEEARRERAKKRKKPVADERLEATRTEASR
ncbi:hypothetical protein QOZ80_2BG0195740 [Eleusine coracana subsp. coracana]|nr:hypothetical protein QOZ80_2BG0195740 [Eleusine coracana subsp. coracana]